MIIPNEGYILVELKDEYSHIAVADQKYATKTRGVCISVGDIEHENWVGHLVYWESYKDDTKVNETQAFIKSEYVMGYQEEVNAAE
jgi:desulfoferrodoxin (superoxide reductase-like protein)